MPIHGNKGSIYRRLSNSTGHFFSKVIDTTSWSLTVTQQTIDTQFHEKNYIERTNGPVEWTATVEGAAQTERANTNLVSLMIPSTTSTVPGATLYVRLRNASGTSVAYEGLAILSDVSVTTPADGLATMSASLVGTGSIVYKSVT